MYFTQYVIFKTQQKLCQKQFMILIWYWWKYHNTLTSVRMKTSEKAIQFWAEREPLMNISVGVVLFVFIIITSVIWWNPSWAPNLLRQIWATARCSGAGRAWMLSGDSAIGGGMRAAGICYTLCFLRQRNTN